MSKGRPWHLALRAALQGVSLAVLIQSSPAEPSTLACREPTTLRFDIVSKITRSEIGFTQELKYTVMDSTRALDVSAGQPG